MSTVLVAIALLALLMLLAGYAGYRGGLMYSSRKILPELVHRAEHDAKSLGYHSGYRCGKDSGFEEGRKAAYGELKSLFAAFGSNASKPLSSYLP